MNVPAKDVLYTPFGIGAKTRSNSGDGVGSDVGDTNIADTLDAEMTSFTGGNLSASTLNSLKAKIVGANRLAELHKGVAVVALSDNMFVSVTPGAAGAGQTAISVQLSAGVGVSTTEAKIGQRAKVNVDPDGGNWKTTGSANALQNLVVRAIADSKWIALSGGAAVGGKNSVGVGASLLILSLIHI